MSGIAGVVGDAGTPTEGAARASLELVQRMCDVISHRGPDGHGLHADGRAALGMRRLTIVEVAGGHQPVRNEEGTVVAVFDGELYNVDELRAHRGCQRR